MHASWILRVDGRSIYPWWNLPTRIVIIRVYKWHPMRHFMGGLVDLRFVGQRWGRDLYGSGLG